MKAVTPKLGWVLMRVRAKAATLKSELVLARVQAKAAVEVLVRLDKCRWPWHGLVNILA